MYEEFLLENLKESDHLKDLEVKLMIFFEKDYKVLGLKNVGWENVVRDVNRWRFILNIMKLRVTENAGNFLSE